jgi:hypothetical protein
MNGDFWSMRLKHLWQICDRIGGKTVILGHQWNKRAERIPVGPIVIEAGRFAVTARS